MRGLMVDVFKTREGDCSNRGVSFYHSTVILVGEGIPEIFEVTEDRPAVHIVRRTLKLRDGSRGDYFHAEPVSHPGRHWMFGGTFLYCSDSRFPFDYPIKLHDRYEGSVDYGT